MKRKWLIRLPVQILTGCAALFVARHLLPPVSTTGTGFKLSGSLLSAFSGVLVVVDLFWGLVSRKLDESLGSGSALTAREKDRWRRAAFEAERDLMSSLIVTVLLKAAAVAVGIALASDLVPPEHRHWTAQVGFFVLGFVLPTVFLMPMAYLSARQARLRLTVYEEEQAERAKALQELNATPAHDFKADPGYAGFGRVVAPKG